MKAESTTKKKEGEAGKGVGKAYSSSIYLAVSLDRDNAPRRSHTNLDCLLKIDPSISSTPSTARGRTRSALPSRAA
jgi:hypothetical protein